MRVAVSVLCLLAALLLSGASMAMNWSFWIGQGVDVGTARLLGAVSIAVDVFKATLPLVIAWASAQRVMLAYRMGMLFFCGCLCFSFVSALGFAVSSRGAASESRAVGSIRYAAAEAELRDMKGRIAVLGSTRPEAVVEEALARLKQDRRWASSSQCNNATVDQSRDFCRGFGDLRVELAGAVEARKLRAKSAALEAEIEGLVGAGARLETDRQAGFLARLTGIGLQGVQTGMVLLFAVLVEVGAAFGLLFALVPLQGGLRLGPTLAAGRGRAALRLVAVSGGAGLGPPTRFVRGADGRLLIE
jgi:hypothetical protein